MTGRMPFGKYKGMRLEDVPISYLEWVLENCTNLSPSLRAEIFRLLDAEPLDNVQALALPSLANRWYRQLSREFHPDLGGSHEGMKAINRAHDLLLEMAGVAG
jgi:uncharacterized protein (DUF3820 family)